MTFKNRYAGGKDKGFRPASLITSLFALVLAVMLVLVIANLDSEELSLYEESCVIINGVEYTGTINNVSIDYGAPAVFEIKNDVEYPYSVKVRLSGADQPLTVGVKGETMSKNFSEYGHVDVTGQFNVQREGMNFSFNTLTFSELMTASFPGYEFSESSFDYAKPLYTVYILNEAGQILYQFNVHVRIPVQSVELDKETVLWIKGR